MRTKYTQGGSELDAEPRASAAATETGGIYIKKLRGRRGALKDLPTMPWDVLYATFSRLDPLDLLRLARTTKDFRAFLMSKTSLQIWKAARKNIVGLPDCPEDMSEPQYANLAFSSHCHRCFKICLNIDWYRRERLCKACKSRDGSHELRHSLVDEGFSPDVHSADLLSIPFKDFGNLVVLDRSQVHDLRDEHIQEFRTRWSELTQENKEIFKMLHKTRVEAMASHAMHCTNWYENWREARSDERGVLRRSRRESIFQKLREAGWFEEYALLPYKQKLKFSLLKEMNQPTALTDRIWKRIQPKVISFLEMNSERLHRLRRTSTCTRPDPLDRISPPPRPAAGQSTVCNVIHTPHDVQDLREDFEVLRPVFNNCTEQWRQLASHCLRTLLKEAVGFSEADDVDPLTLAVGAYWKCERCKSVCLYPEVLVHTVKCQTCRDSADAHLLLEHIGSYIKTAAPHLKAIIELFGMDPTQVTGAQLDRVQERVACYCESDNQAVDSVCIMTWRAAILHASHADVHSNAIAPAWFLASWDQIEISRPLEYGATWHARRLYEDARIWRCALCPVPKMNREDAVASKIAIERHIRDIHGILFPTQDHVVKWVLSSSFEHRPVYLLTTTAMERRRSFWRYFMDYGEACVVSCL